LDPQHPVTLGLHQENLEFDKGFHIQDLPFDLVSMHGYSILAPWAEDPLDSDVVPFLNVLTEHLAGKPVIFQEFGIPTAPSGSPERILNKVLIFKKEVTLVLASEDEAATYYKEVLEKLYLVGSLGAVAWCFSDYDPSIWNRFPLDKNVIERFMGIVRSDGNLKYAGKVLHEFALQRKKVVSCPIKLNILRENYYNNPLKNLKEAFKEFKKKIREITFI
jgi:endo-1,4-beta-mannosidase